MTWLGLTPRPSYCISRALFPLCPQLSLFSSTKDVLICSLGIRLRALLKHVYSVTMKVVHEGREIAEEAFDGSRRR